MPLDERAEQSSTSSAGAKGASWPAEPKALTNPSASGASGSKTGGLIEQLRNQATARLSDQKERAVASLGTVVEAVRHTGEQLGEKNPTLGSIVETTAKQLERWSSTLKAREVPQLVDDLKLYARRRPVVFIGVGAAAGFLAVRFLKSSGAGSRDDDEDRVSSSGESSGRRSSLAPARPAVAADRLTSTHTSADTPSPKKGDQPLSAKRRS